MFEPAEKKIKTDYPDGNDADGKCEEYQLFHCKGCINANKHSRLYEDHSSIANENVQEIPNTEISQDHFCPKHPEHHIEFYCAIDEELCCVSCTVNDHKGHVFEKIKDAACKRKSLIEESLQDAYKTNITLQNQNAMQANSVERMKKESERNINKMIDDMKLQLDQRRNQLLSELQQESSEMFSTIENSLAAYDSTLAVLEFTDTFLANNAVYADDVEMLHYPAFRRNRDALQRQLEASDLGINEDKLKFLPTQRTTFDGLVSQLGAFGGQCTQSPEDQHTLAAPMTMAVTQESGCTLAQGKTLTVRLYKGDLATLTTDVIVNSVGQDLSPIGRLSEYVAASAGPQMSEQLDGIVREEGRVGLGSVVVTDAGLLPCKKIFNLVASSQIKSDIINCLCEATNRNLTSIAFNSLCWYEGHFENIVKTVKCFDQDVTGGTLQEVHIVAADDRHFADLQEQVKTIWPQVSEIEQEDIDVIRKYLKPCSGALLCDVTQRMDI